MKKSSAVPKYRQPQLDDNRTLAEQAASANAKPARSPAVKPTAGRDSKVVPIRHVPAKRPASFWGAVPGLNSETLIVLFCCLGAGLVFGIPLGAWLFVTGVALW